MKICVVAVASCFALSLPIAVRAQEDQPRQPQQGAPVIDIQLSRTIATVNYQAKSSTEVNFRGTALLPEAKGEATVESKSAGVTIEAKFEELAPASRFGSAYLTYVLWAISPEGRPSNLGELPQENGKTKMRATTSLQTFGMIVTAEPYYAVSSPSEYVILENIPRKDTKGAVRPVNASYELLRRGRYNSANLLRLSESSDEPLALLEARNAERIARWQRADRYAPDAWARAEASLGRAEDYQKRKQHKPVLTAAREAVQSFEDAITVAVQRQKDEQTAQERAAAAQREEQARAEKEAAAQQQAEAERQKAQAEAQAAREAQARADAERQQAAAEAEREREQAAAQAEQERQRQQALAAQKQAEQAAQQTAQAQQQAQQAQQQAEQARQQAEQQRQAAERAQQEQQQLRAQLLQQFNRILETRETARGLIVSLGDVLFATAKYDLQPEARERLAKLAGIVLAHPGLHLAIEGYTDSVGSEIFNQKLSEERADSVRAYLIAQGLDPNSISTTGYGMSHPVADNSTSQGRQKNRRVEIVVSGEIIGVPIGIAPTNAQP